MEEVNKRVNGRWLLSICGFYFACNTNRYLLVYCILYCRIKIIHKYLPQQIVYFFMTIPIIFEQNDLELIYHILYRKRTLIIADKISPFLERNLKSTSI